MNHYLKFNLKNNEYFKKSSCKFFSGFSQIEQILEYVFQYKKKIVFRENRIRNNTGLKKRRKNRTYST